MVRFNIDRFLPTLASSRWLTFMLSSLTYHGRNGGTSIVFFASLALTTLCWLSASFTHTFDKINRHSRQKNPHKTIIFEIFLFFFYVTQNNSPYMQTLDWLSQYNSQRLFSHFATLVKRDSLAVSVGTFLVDPPNDKAIGHPKTLPQFSPSICNSRQWSFRMAVSDHPSPASLALSHSETFPLETVLWAGVKAVRSLFACFICFRSLRVGCDRKSRVESVR